MCQYNLLLIKSDSQILDIKEIFTQCSLGYKEITNNVKSQGLSNIDQYKVICTTVGHCDCGSIIGSNSEQKYGDALRKVRNKLMLKKWSESKIERYLATKEKSTNKNQMEIGLGMDEEGIRFLSLFRSLSDQNIRFGFIFHHFENDLDLEEIAVHSHRFLSIKDLKVRSLELFQENEIVWFDK